MVELKEVETEAPKKERRSPQRSEVAFPVYGLPLSIEVAEAIRSRAGGVCTRDQLAHFLSYSTTRSGAYLSRFGAAKMFGLIHVEGENVYASERANQILSPVFPADAANAKVEAFLSVELFRRVYEQYQGQTLPPEVGLKNLFQNSFKISPDRVHIAYRALVDSAECAGFFPDKNRNRLIKPVVSGAPSPEEKAAEVSREEQSQDLPADPPKRRAETGGGGDDGTPPGVHTAIVGLLRELPPPGTAWAVSKKNRFMQAFKSTIDFIYPDPEQEGSQ